MSERYGTTRIHASIAHFLSGKAVSSLAGFVAIILIVKALSVEEFAAYSVLIPLEDILASLSALGLTHAILRYVPELYAKHYHTALLRFVAGSVLLRLVGVVLAAALAYILADGITDYIGLGGAERAYKVFLLIVVLRSCGNFVSEVLESCLHQASAQAGHVVATLGRLGGIVLLTQGSARTIGLVQILQVEVVAETFGAAVLLAGLVRMFVLKGSEDPPADDRTWARANFRRMLRFALSGYVQHLTFMLYGTPNRLVGGHYLAPAAMAAYGFCTSAIYHLRRYLPAQLLMGVIRPVIVARYAEAQDFPGAVRTSNLMLRVNVMLIGIAIAYIPVVGERTILTLTGGKYGAGTMLLLLTLAVRLLLDTQRQLLEVLVQAVEQYHLLIPANLLLSASILPAIVAVPAVGAIALPLSNAAGLVLANYWVVSRMRANGFPFRYAWGELLRISVAVAAALGAGLLAVHLRAAWWAVSLAVLVAYLVAIAKLCRQDILELYRAARNGGNSPAKPKPFPETEERQPLRIVFGILSSRDSSLAIAQIADCVRPHRVIVHHDYSKCPQFTILRDNISVLPARTATAWGDWSLVEATLMLMAEALADPRCTHFQLLSESCLPIHGIAAFERFLERDRPDAMIDLIPLDPGSAALASHGWRYLPRGALMRQVARRASVWWLGTMPGHRQETSVDLHLPGNYEHWAIRLRQSIGRAVVNRFQSRWLGAFPMGNFRRCWVGGQWFAVSRAMAEHILAIVNSSPKLIRHFSHCHIPDEAFIHTVVAHSGSTRIYPGNHALFWDGSGMGPDVLGLKDIERVRASGKFFARKLPLDPASPVRRPFLQTPIMQQAQITP